MFFFWRGREGGRIYGIGFGLPCVVFVCSLFRTLHGFLGLDAKFSERFVLGSCALLGPEYTRALECLRDIPHPGVRGSGQSVVCIGVCGYGFTASFRDLCCKSLATAFRGCFTVSERLSVRYN